MSQLSKSPSVSLEPDQDRCLVTVPCEAKPEFFQWAAKVVTGHQQVGSDSVLLMPRGRKWLAGFCLGVQPNLG